MLTADDRRTLLDLARRSVAAAAAGEPLPADPPPGPFTEHGAAFITLRQRGDLRGCIGHIHPTEPLWLSVRNMARSAAVADPRFPPVTPEEVEDLHVGISVLSPMRRITGPGEILIGEHGLYIKKDKKNGLLLPHVAVDNHWDAKRFLEQACHKAELLLTDWQDAKTEIYVFTAEVFEEAA